MKPPLPEQLRPSSFDHVYGQEHLVGKDGFLTKMVRSKRPLSIILWGPPGTGKTSMARVLATAFDLQFRSMSPIFSGISELKKMIKEIEESPLMSRGTLLFVDEIHRFNRAQQDAFLPYLEKGSFTLIGATAENPSFYLNNALLSRTRVLTLNPLSNEALEQIIVRYEESVGTLNISKEKRKELIQYAGGDGRYLLHLIENVETDVPLQSRSATTDEHFNLISALHKSIRQSDENASLYWFQRMIKSGDDPRYIARRLIRIASEDVGLADPQAVAHTVAAKQAYETLGSPEGELALAEAVLYLALAPKSRAVYDADQAAHTLADHTSHLPAPMHILNAPTKLMKELGYGSGDKMGSFFPEGVSEACFYKPQDLGFEREMKKRIDYYRKMRKR